MDKKEINLILPWPPSVNQIWSTTRKGNWYSSKVAKDFKEMVSYYVTVKRARNAFVGAVPLNFEMLAYPPDNRRRDLDNLAKVVFDALQGASVFENDCQIKKMYMEMCGKSPGGKVLVTLSELE